MRVLVTGGAGFIGSNLVKALVARGNEVVALDNYSSSQKGNLDGVDCTFVEGDIVEYDFSSLGKFDVIFHQAAITDTLVTDEEHMMRVNVGAFERLLSFAQAINAKVVYASSAGVYGNNESPQSEGQDKNPLNAYARSKAKMDDVAMEWFGRLPLLVGLRYFNVYGPGEQFKGHAASMIYQLTQQMKSGKQPRIFVDGGQCRDFIYVKDVVNANLLASQAPQSCIVNVGTGRGESFNTLIAHLNSVLGTELLPDYFECPYDFFQTHTCADITLAKEKIGFEPHYTFGSGIRDYHKENQIS